MFNPIDNPDQWAAEGDVRAMRQDPRAEAVRSQIARFYGMGYGDRLPEECRPHLDALADEFLTNWFFKAAASDSQHPRLVRNFMPAYEWHGASVPGSRTGGDNPDNCYRLAGIAHGTRYRLTGRLAGGKPANVSIALTNNYGTSPTVELVEDHQLAWQADGSFVVTIDESPSAGRTNHLMTHAGTKFLFVRDSMMDWTDETPLDLSIERLGEARAAPLGLEEMFAEGTAKALSDVYQYFWFQNMLSSLSVNTMPPPQTLAGVGVGLTTQGVTTGHFCLGPDDAAIIDYDPADAGYAAVELTDWLYRSLDYHFVQSSLTAAQSSVDPDGRIRAVIARRDPGVANWLDTGGQANVLMILRWQAMKSQGRPIDAKLHLTTIDRLRSELPASTVWFDADERAAQIAGRVAAYGRRIARNA
ncbi:hypothetical protein [Novosphingobium taihuense]|uniref:DUF1214 domain-containing protein n=1 Tax=Novosphingobium taihuense TaxID=260085 RepID=A0A7W7ACG6_9SPHN|nr:hypothetical protein [Novosphingobium taihuense]MBB4614316.1 hypothetical protein [Novosphingobium taihuense]TWH87162.1 hypothetical protein IQ25_01439 [Novosphingobium taihuense]